MEYAAIAKLKAGQTLYVVCRERGSVDAIFIKKVQSVKISETASYSGVTGMAWSILQGGKTPIVVAPAEEQNVGFSPCEGHEDIENFPVTLSKKQAIRWAKEGYAIATGVWAVSEKWIVRFEVREKMAQEQPSATHVEDRPGEVYRHSELDL